ncbi:MAG: NYN domain-containing protein [Candidatus Omnitrophica bacterium]|nr:NYN domain-containing protein [Candidatus Omnitrophota bacterium]
MSEPKNRAIVFIDGNNLYRGLRDCYGIERLDVEPFCRFLTQQHELRAIYYADANFLQERGQENYKRQQSYFSHLRSVKGLIFRRGYYGKWTMPPVEKRSDVYLAVDLVDLCHRDEFDVAYLISGDSDLTPAVDIVIREGKRVINVYFDKPQRNSYALRQHCQGHFLEITQSLAEQFQWRQK